MEIHSKSHENILNAIDSRQREAVCKLGSCSSLLKSSKLNSIQKKRSRADVIIQMHPPPTTHNFLKLLEWWFSLSFSSQSKWNIIPWLFKIFFPKFSKYFFQNFQNIFSKNFIIFFPKFSRYFFPKFSKYFFQNFPNIFL